MTQSDIDWIVERFAARARDWTPAAATHAARVLHATVSRDPAASRRFASVLSDPELERADRFLTGHDRARFIQRRAFRRYCGAAALGMPRLISQICFRETEKGRPYLPDSPDFCFSFSSCRSGFLGAWSSTHGIGVDLEDSSRELEAAELARRFFSNAEARTIEASGGPAQLRTFFQLWSLKEAALKSVGEGLPFGLDAFEFELAPRPRVVRAPHDHGGPEQFDAHLLEGRDTCTAVVIRSD